MKKFLLPCLSFMLIVINMIGCKSTEEDVENALPFNPYVEAFTSGKISRTSPVYLIFNKDIEEDKLTTDNLKKALKIKPGIKGNFSFENNRTITFRPDNEFDRDKTYTITADISRFFNVDTKDRNFTFSFTTLPLSLRASLKSLDVNSSKDSSYDILADLYTPDVEDAATVESLIKISEKADVSWQHDPNGKRHVLKLAGIEAGDNGVREMKISVNNNKLGASRDEILSVYIPGKNDFGVYDIKYISDPERFIEVTFSQNLDESQDLQGLAYIRSNNNTTVYSDGNKIRLYPDPGSTGTAEIYLDESIRSNSGLLLESDIRREIEIGANVPEIKFIGEGVIIPQSSQLLVPFKAVYLRGVVVRIIKIMEHNIGQFLQENRLDGQSELMRVGRIMARKTIFFDEQEQDLTNWGTYAIDMKELMDPEPGAIYRVEISFDRDLSIYPCDDQGEPKSKEQIASEDEIKLMDEMSRFDEGGYYYYYNDFDWSDYDYRERNNPCHKSFYSHTNTGRNVMATNLAIIAKNGESNEMNISVHNILNTSPEKGIDIKVYNYQNQEIGKGSTDENGTVKIKLEKTRPYYVMATDGKQRSYLKVDNGSALSLSSFDVSGEVVQKGLKGFIYGDRGVWRPGDILYLSFMLNDRSETLPAEHPVVMELYNPLGQLYLSRTQSRGALGLYAFEMPTDPDAPTGAWEVKVNVGGVSFTKRIRIESIKPNRLKIDLNFDEEVLLRGQDITGKMHIEWLQGATARNLRYEIDGAFAPVKTSFSNFKDFVFDDPTKEFESEDANFTSGTTDEIGNATFGGRLGIGDAAPGMLAANFTTRVYEESGDFSIDAVRLSYSPYKSYAGIKSPQKTKGQLNTGSKHVFEVASVDYTGKPVAGNELKVEVYKVEWYWWWSSNYNRLANYISNSYNRPVRNLDVTTNSSGTATIDLNFTDDEWGTYYIVVRDKTSGHSAGLMSYFDWPGYGGRRDTEGSDAATMLTFKTDKDTYAPGEKMSVIIPSSDGGRAVVTIENGSRVLSTSEHICSSGQTKITLDVTEDMQPNAYVYISLLQPHGATVNDLPIRMYGVQPVTVTSSKSRLNPVISAPEEIKPETDYTISVSEKDGREMAYTIAIVDEGLLDLTRFQTPDPWNAFNAREALGVSTWDMYNFIVGAYGGRIEQLFSIGGDDALGRGPKAIVNRFKPVVQFDGPFNLKKGGKQKHTYRMPNYNGRVRMMVIAGDGKAYGNTEKSVMVRKPVMLLGTLPRVIGMGEEMVVPANVFATEKNIGDVEVSVSVSGNMEVIGSSKQQLSFSEITDKSTYFRIKAGSKPGASKVTLTAVSKNDKSLYETDIEIRSVRRSQTKVISATVGAGSSWNQSFDLPGAEGTNSLALEVSDVQPVNLTARLGFLLGYPHGCIEQITSKGFPQLYLKQFANLTKEQTELAEESVKEVIRRQRTYQVAEGGFSYWPGGTSSNAWGTVYATHFQLEAESKGYLVPESMKRNALNNLRLVARNWRSVDNYYSRSEELTQAYRLYVLALANTAELGAMNRLKENKNITPVAKWMLAAAYATSGRADIARSIIENTSAVTNYEYGEYDYTYGSDIRDKAIRLITLIQLGMDTEAAEIYNDISRSLSSDDWMSTQTTSFSLVALSKYMDKYRVSENMDFNYVFAGNTEKVQTVKNIWSAKLLENGGTNSSLEFKNNGSATVFLRLVTEGVPHQGEEDAYSSGIQVNVVYQDMNGKILEISELTQGTNFTAVVTVRNPTSKAYNNIVLTQIFPAGWEILNTRFTDENAKDIYPPGVNYQDIRDDRVYSYMDRLPSGREVTVKINLAAVYEGVFYHPPVYAEAMYDNLVRANTQGRNVSVIK